MKKKIILTLMVMAITIFALAIVSSATVYYVDDEGNVSTEATEDTVYHFEPGGDRNIDGNKCFRIATIYLHDTTATKIVFPVASEVKSGYTGIAPQAGWNSSLAVYAVDETGNVIITTETQENVSYATQIAEVEFLSGVDFDGANGQGAFSGFTALKTLTVRGNLSVGGDAYTKGGYFSNTQISEVNIYGSGNIQIGAIRHLSSKKPLTVIFHEGCTSTVNLNLNRGYLLPSNSLTDWKIIINPELTFTAERTKDDGSVDLSFYDKEVTGLTLVMAVTNEKAYEGTDLKTSHGIYNFKTGEAPMSAEVKTYCQVYEKHGTLEEINACVSQCVKCLEFSALENPEHVMAEAYEYSYGYTLAGNKHEYCSNEGCTYTLDTEIPALFTSKGYSKDETSNAIVLEIVVDNEAVDAYEAYLKSVNEEATLVYGIVVAIADNDDDTSNDVLFDESGAVKAGAIAMKFDNNSFTKIQTKITGIGEGNYNTALHCSGYVNVNGKISYINGAESADYAKKVSYNSIPDDTTAGEE